MESRHLDTLATGVHRNPDNLELRLLLVRGLLERGRVARAYALVRHFEPSGIADPELQRLVAHVCLAAGHPREALRFTMSDEARSQRLRASILLRLADRQAARQCYRAAIETCPELAQEDLRRELGVDTPAARRARFRLLPGGRARASRERVERVPGA